MLDAFLAGAHQVFAFDTLTYMLIGSVAGIIAAAIPGFTVTMAIILTLPLTFAINSLNRSMGQQDLYPFVLSAPAIDKLAYVHRVIRESAGRPVQGT